jgi:hypothetical protein
MRQVGSKRDAGFLRAIPQRIGKVVSFCWMLCMASAVFAQTQFPSDFGQGRRRLVSAKSWTVSGLTYLWKNGYQWLPDGRIFVWIGNDDKWQALLVDTKTGKQEALPLFSRLYIQANPPKMGADYSYVTPDGKSVGSFLNAFSASSPPIVEFYRTLSLDGYDMHIQRIAERRRRKTYYTPFLAWEWNDAYHGWVQFALFNNGRTGLVGAVAHFDLAHPETPRMVEMTPVSLPEWCPTGTGFGRLVGVMANGEGVLTPPYLENLKEWTQEHIIPISLVDIDKGTRSPMNYLISVPRDGSLEQYVLSPDAHHIVWLLQFHKPHAVPGHTKLYKTDEIWICDLDGANMHRLAYQAIGSESVDDAIRDVAWKDNQTVSFFLGGVLYSIPL